ncbi:uncharacterized protein [Symphalangus syndactylus]|uniref:uncharacterized protein n=1 Tax=Symphalangus syndactylus TaxID=9590 RepID=UPI003004FAB0
MNPSSNKQKPNRVTFEPLTLQVSWKSNLPGLCQSEREAFEFIVEFLEEEHMSEFAKLKFLRAVETLSSAVHAQADGNMDNYYPKAILAQKIESGESTIPLVPKTGSGKCGRLQPVLSAAHRAQPVPKRQCESLPPEVGDKEIGECPQGAELAPWQSVLDTPYLFTCRTVQALDDMLPALVMDSMNPSMLILQNFLEIILPWSLLSDKVHEQMRALGTISRLLRFICNFPGLSHMEEFSMSGKLMSIFGLFVMGCNHEISIEASEALHYLFKILVLQRILQEIPDP